MSARKRNIPTLSTWSVAASGVSAEIGRRSALADEGPADAEGAEDGYPAERSLEDLLPGPATPGNGSGGWF